MQFEISKVINIGQVGITQLEIPIYTFGQGEPVLGITCYLHGDETAGIYVLANVVDYLKAHSYLFGTIHLIPVANPAAQFVKNRLSPIDALDINRLRQGNKEGTITERNAFYLFEFLVKCDLVINLHTFEMISPVTAVFMNAGAEEVRNKTLAAMKAFSPEIIWITDALQNRYSAYQSTLDVTLAEAGVTNFSIETSEIMFLTDEQIRRTSQGILNVTQYMGILKESFSDQITNEPQIISQRKVFTANVAGLWQPSVNLMQTVEPNTQVGILTTLHNFEPQDIYATDSGIIFQYRHRQHVATGTSLFSVGYV
ncbi:succinylglutamate desuccinylase/aspartoacylase family protein [Iningainema tapete]|uniref:Succinylglutamate desuccinylase/aspartoacylase family protein n=1 Tax=Iningainema tapete BLCC-T55 TaxID=2748662 RepID=A0A8J6XGS3_9CYAN|nr:succinylglutamate desuccinylase/aspartoacylase family protein [Iningainema tapete]MBD2775614.1 succinylglutamate desuccinylase/aspartoacylase family protein [Iningainema tapete BLCC-T55]